MKKIMLVEDESLILMGLKNILDWQRLGFCITHMASNGREALKLWEKEPVDIVITDLNMPVMDGLTLLGHLREMDSRVQFIILTGYDEFEYARAAVHLRVEEYILKPINEEELEAVLLKAAERSDAMSQEKFVHIKERASMIKFLEGSKTEQEAGEQLKPVYKLLKEAPLFCVLLDLDMDHFPVEAAAEAFGYLNSKSGEMVVFPDQDNRLILFIRCDGSLPRETVAALSEELETRFGLLTFAGISPVFESEEEIPSAYEAARKLLKYRLVEGFGSYADQERLQAASTLDVTLDETFLSKLILKKSRDSALNYLEDLFINNVKADTSADDIYQIAVKTAVFLEDMKQEYYLTDKNGLLELSELINAIYRAGNLAALRSVLAGEVLGIMDCLHSGNSQFTPVVRQILSEMEADYRTDMNLKTLAYKYHMNPSYLGQIFQKEVGLQFSQYLANKKSSRARELILTTNRKISVIAQEVGYPDTSYFYRKFKQTYGVSPTTLREMQKS